MNFDLTDDQEALRDGIRALCAGRFTVDRVRGGFDRSMWDELAETGVFSLLADGFGWADAAIAFEELGRAVVPGPARVGRARARRRRRRGRRGRAAAPTRAAAMVEHLDATDALVVLDDGGAVADRSGIAGRRPSRSTGRSTRSRPVHRVGVVARR